MSYERELAFAKETAKAAGDMILRGFSVATTATWKADNTPLTETDTAINDMVIGNVRAAFPADGVLGEEASFGAKRDRLWVVDPLDGTQAFDVGAPLATFCLALVENGKVVLGVVYDPFEDRMYSAMYGQGAFLNEQPLHVSDANSLAQNYAVLSSRSLTSYKATGELYDAIVEHGGKPFSFRSVVYGYMRVAAGKAVVAVAGYLQPWDYAAAKVILEEAGATITNFAGEYCEYDQVGGGIVVSNGRVHQQVLELISDKGHENTGD
ncbi:MAG TPA: inositol monophosphatase [Candidatus Saccharimonadales bacterium]|nr:inositol monophosphatase [Candidatus Saccharimonadales bacterium]